MQLQLYAVVRQVYAVVIAVAGVSALNHHFGVVLAVLPTCSYNLSPAVVITVVPG